MSRRILVVDDDHDIRATVVELLCDRGYDAVGAEDGLEALETLQGRSPWNLILLDLMMPRMDGREMRAAQRKDPALAEIPVVLISATTDVPQVAEELGAIAYLVKPVRLAELLATIERVCPW